MSQIKRMSKRVLMLPWKLISKVWFVLWTLWSIVITCTLVVLLATATFYHFASRRSLDPDRITLMPAPTIVADGVIDPFDDSWEIDVSDGVGMVFATDRARSGQPDQHYENDRGFLLRVGSGRVHCGEDIDSWDKLKAISVQKQRDRDYLMRVGDVTEYGILPESRTALDSWDERLEGEVSNQFAERINRKLRQSNAKDVFIYVHGYKVVFENPLLVASELWHYMGYEGVMIAYSWPSTPHALAYFADLQTTTCSARSLRILVEFVAKKTEAERIHILGYSAGTGLVLSALNQMALLCSEHAADEIATRYRLENVILVCSDVDRGIFANQLANGIARIPRQLTIYASQADSTLGMSQTVFGRQRLGQLLDGETLSRDAIDFLNRHPNLTFIDVSRAENIEANNGHAYFHKSPWVSSDLLLVMRSGLTPEQRCLERSPSGILWRFPTDYPSRLQAEAERLRNGIRHQ